MQKLLTRKFLLPALATALLVTGATAFLQSGFGRVILNCYTPFTTSPIEGGVQIDCPEGELVIAQVTVTPTPAATLTPLTGTPMSTPRGTATKAATVTLTKTNTPVSTLTPVPTFPGLTATPQGTPTPVGSLPLCAEHNPLVWHALISDDGKCHYDHPHDHDPMGSSAPSESCAKETFGEPGAWFNSPGQSISYFWETHEENKYKHPAYSWVVRCDIPPDSNPLDKNPTFTKAFRVQIHADPMPFLLPGGIWGGGYLGKQHSYSVEAQVCIKEKPDECGIIKWGGWLNFGDLELRQGDIVITQCVALIDVSSECPHGPGGSKIHFDNANFPPTIPTRGGTFFWYGEVSMSLQKTVGVLEQLVIAVARGDSIVDVQLDTLFTPDKAMFCPQQDCPYNGSTISLHELTFAVKANLFDPDGDGFASGIWLVDQYLRFNEHCIEIGHVTDDGLFCIPLIMEHVPIGQNKFGDPENLGITVNGTQEFDTSPAGEWWITWARDMIFGEQAEHQH